MKFPFVTKKMRDVYAFNDPFSFLIIDNFLPKDLAAELSFSFPKPDEKWISYNNKLENLKFANDRLETMPDLFSSLLLQMNSGQFVSFLEEISGLKRLIVDCKFRGGGLHSTAKGGHLMVHSDRGIHPNGLYRRLNFILYLSHWQSGDGGELELFSKDMKSRKIITPYHNRAVLFETNKHSFHGHANPWRGEENRNSIATYYFSTEPPRDGFNEESTRFMLRPEDEQSPEVLELIQMRNKGRIHTGIDYERS